MTDDLLLMGHCGRAHGVRGEIKVFPETDDPQRLVKLKRVFVGSTRQQASEYAVKQARLQPLKGRVLVLLKLDGINDREAAEALRNEAVYALLDELPPLKEGEVFLHDLIGLTVVEQGNSFPLGVVVDVLDGAQNLIVVSRDGQPNVLIPDVPEFVLSVDLSGKQIVVDLPEGLIE